MNAKTSFKHIADRFPETNPKITELPSGALILDVTIGGERYCAEYFPSHQAFGLSKIRGSSPFWEGVEQSFASAEELELKIIEIMRQPNRV